MNQIEQNKELIFLNIYNDVLKKNINYLILIVLTKIYND